MLRLGSYGSCDAWGGELALDVVTAHLIDEAGQPTIAARDEILSFFAERLA